MFSAILVTVPNEEMAVRIEVDLVEKRLAACANFCPNRSIYRWNGKMPGMTDTFCCGRYGRRISL